MSNNLFASSDQESQNEQSEHSSNSNTMLWTGWLMSLVVVGLIGFFIGHSNQPSQSTLGTQTQTATNQITPAPTATPQVTSTVLSNSSPVSISPTETNSVACTKAGFAQKWEYLTPYVIRDGDTIESIATSQLKDSSRVNEILQINGVGPLVVGSTLYLPPSNIPKSSGNLKEVYGKLVEKNDTSWHVSFTADTSGQGVLMPSFLFNSVSNKDSFKIGDCIKVFFDDGYTVYNVSLQ